MRFVDQAVPGRGNASPEEGAPGWMFALILFPLAGVWGSVALELVRVVLSITLVYSTVWLAGRVLSALRKIGGLAPLVATPLLYFAVIVGFHIFGNVIDEPRPEYFGARWLAGALTEAVPLGLVAATAVAILITTDGLVGSRTGMPWHARAYYPRLMGVRESLARRSGRLVFLMGHTLLFSWYATTSVDFVAIMQGRHGLVWAPKRIFFLCILCWALLWIVDCFSRSRRTGLWVAIASLVACLVLLEHTTPMWIIE